MQDAEYLLKREMEERQAAEEAPDATIRQIHLEMADAYRRLAGLQAGDPTNGKG